MTDLLRSPLYDRHVALGAKLADFGGWEMPIEYGASGGGVLKEHAAVREAVGVFDVSHLGKARARGAGAADFVNRSLSNDLGRIRPGKAQYTLCCDDPTGGVVDDLIAYLFAADDVFLVPNAAIRNLIREDKIHQIYSSMQTGQEKYGMQTFNQSLATLYFTKQISLQTALGMSSNPDELQDMINRGAGLSTPQAGSRPPVRPAGR